MVGRDFLNREEHKGHKDLSLLLCEISVFSVSLW